MSIVEKAAEKLKAMPPESPASPPAEPPSTHAAPAHAAPPRAVSTVERLQQRTQVVDQPAEAVPSLHVDPTALKQMGLLPADEEAERRLADELRGVKRPLLANATEKGVETLARGKRIVVTSAESGEGKTFTAVNLALSLAREADFEVLLVDGDIPKSDITRIFGISGKPGLMDVLADDKLSPADVIIRTDVPNLLVVPAGERHLLAAELFRSRRMEYVLEEFGGRNRRRLLVFDSSPLLATSESQVLASHMGQVVMVVAAGRTGRQVVASALRRISDLPYVGLVLNMSSSPAGENDYNSHSDYLRALKGGA
ncbi:exopolysaccharide biosynthesis protein [Rhodanobacter sp. Root627]|uniref:AAA family ATPase n=1 Tax=Rhodanobacter sp. Root627 TaxID=1736572 RepID=UPI0006F20D26|nr:AAA family ATPase [Rhodanobacter sp. Root627]KRA33143.1 exopolysaccharide biosynthesis protein [Rhodanobacter sp. Root627]